MNKKPSQAEYVQQIESVFSEILAESSDVISTILQVRVLLNSLGIELPTPSPIPVLAEMEAKNKLSLALDELDENHLFKVTRRLADYAQVVRLSTSNQLPTPQSHPEAQPPSQTPSSEMPAPSC